jgi:hypothetical protein
MMEQTAPAAVEFDGRVYTADNLLRALRDAALGFVPSDDPHIALDPTGWAVVFVRALRDTSLWPALSEAVAELLLSENENEAHFAAHVTRITGVMHSCIMSRALVKQCQYGRMEIVAELAWAIASASISDQENTYDPALRVALMRFPSALGLFVVVSRWDARWFVEHAAAILAEDVDKAASQIAYAQMGAVREPWFAADLRARLATSRPDLAPLC